MWTLFEAARWSASAANEQPWIYIVATREQPEEFARMLSCIEDVNQFGTICSLSCSWLHSLDLRAHRTALRDSGTRFRAGLCQPGLASYRPRIGSSSNDAHS